MKSSIFYSKRAISRFQDFIAHFGLIHLRPYQVEAAQAVIDSVKSRDGESFVWKFARQGGKDETLAALYQYLMLLHSHRDITIIAAAPTFKPQTEIAMRRLADRLGQNIVLKMEWNQRLGYTCQLRRARTVFLSADPSANVVGATAWPLLVMNEAQDIRIDLYDRRFAPMAAAHNATRLFSGTAWTSGTLLAREERLCRQKEQQDGKRRVFIADGPAIGRDHPPYARFLRGERARLGEDHPIYRTQYLCREIDAQAGMFTPARRAMMLCDGSTPSLSPPNAGSAAAAESRAQPAFGGDARRAEGVQHAYVFTLDVAGQDEAAFHNPDEQMLRNPGRDAVSLTIAAVDLSAMNTLQAPIFRILGREQWTGLNHLAVFGRLTALADRWRPQHIVIDATGVGEGLWAMLDKRYPTRVLPVKFSAQKKSELGYRFLAMIETGRLRDCSLPDADATGNVGARQGGRFLPYHIVPGASSDVVALRKGRSSPAWRAQPDEAIPSTTVTRADVDRQYAACLSEVLLGPQKLMRWGVPEGTRDENGDLIHDDILMADALLAEADLLEWRVTSPTLIIPPKDPLDEMSHFRESDQ